MTMKKNTVLWSVLAAFVAAAFMAAPAVFAADKYNPAATSTDFDDWRMECQTKDGKKTCHAFQKIATKDKKQIVLAAVVSVVKVQKTGETVAILNLISPLGVRLTPGMAIQIEKEKQVNVPYQICTGIGCSASLKLDGDLLAKAKNGKQALVAYQRAGAKPDTFALSLKGLGKTIDVLTRNLSGE